MSRLRALKLQSLIKIRLRYSQVIVLTCGLFICSIGIGMQMQLQGGLIAVNRQLSQELLKMQHMYGTLALHQSLNQSQFTFGTSRNRTESYSEVRSSMPGMADQTKNTGFLNFSVETSSPNFVQQVSQQLHELNKNLPKQIEGGSFVSLLSIDLLTFIARLPHVKIYCESGFNAGHSSLVMLAADPSLKVISIDKMVHQYSITAKKHIDARFPGRHLLIQDDVLHALKVWNASKCDFIFSDSHYKPHIAEEALLWQDKAEGHTLFMYEARAKYATQRD